MSLSNKKVIISLYVGSNKMKKRAVMAQNNLRRSK